MASKARKKAPICGHSLNGEPQRRGLCKACYTVCRRRVKLGEVTWEFLETAGLATKATRRPPRCEMSRRIDAALAKAVG